MHVEVRHNPSFAVGRCHLSGGEQVKVESGGMMAHSDGVELEAKMQGGLLGSLKRAALGGESLFVTTYTAPAQGGWVDVAANLPGDLVQATVDARGGIVISRGSWLASSAGVQLDTRWGGFGNLFGGEGGFVIRAGGEGTMLLSCYGALDTLELGPGERVTVDTGHMVAYADTTQMQLRRAAQGGLIQSAKSGEGLVFDFTGPGWVLTQSRNPTALVEWLTSVLPFSRT